MSTGLAVPTHVAAGAERPRRSPWLALRWLVLAVFPIGYLATSHLLPGAEAEYLALSAIAAAAAFLLLLRLDTLAPDTWPVWVTLAAFGFGYFTKFYFLLVTGDDPSLLTQFIISSERLELIAQTDVALFAFRVSVAGFAIFCLTFFLLLGPVGGFERPLERIGRAVLRPTVAGWLTAGAVLIVATSAVAMSLGILSAAELQSRLPFRLGGWILYSRSALVPTLVLAALQLGVQKNERSWVKAAIALLLVLAATDVLIRTTRAALFFTALMLALTYALAQGRIGRGSVRALVILSGIGLLLFPVITSYRTLQRVTGGRASLDLFLESLAFARQEAGIGDIFTAGVFNVLQRFIGVDSLLFLANRDNWISLTGLPALRAGYGNVAEYMTHHIMGFPLDMAHTEAPSLLGWFLIVDGWRGLVVLFPLFLFAGWWLWKRLSRSSLLIKPVAQTHFLILWLTVCTEGTIDALVLQYAAVIASIAGVELWLRSGLRRGAAAAPPGAAA